MEDIMRNIFPIDDLGDNIPEVYHRRCFSPVSTTMIIGPPQAKKSALLMQAAVSEGTLGGQVLFVLPNQPNKLPPSVHAMSQPSSSNMENIRFLFAADPKDLQEYLASLHLKPKSSLPSLLVVDDLEKYVPIKASDDGPQIMVSIAKILSMIQDAAGYCQSVIEESKENSEATAGGSHSCDVLLAWTSLSSYPLKVSEIKSFVSDYCDHVWIAKHLKDKGLCKEYDLTKSQESSLYTISFSVRNIHSPLCEIILQKVAVEKEDIAKKRLSS